MVQLSIPPRITPESLARLREQLASLVDGDVAVLRAADPPPFCLGMDLDRYAHGAPSELAEPLRAYGDCLVALHDAPCPTVAVVEGPAMGGGLGLAATCDVVLATAEACFGLPEATFGLVPGMVFEVLRDRLSPARLRRMALQTDSVAAPEAVAWGLVDNLVDGDVDRALRRQVRRLSRLAPGATREVRSAVGGSVAERIAGGCRRTEALLSRGDVQARVRRFTDEGTAPWEPLAPEAP